MLRLSPSIKYKLKNNIKLGKSINQISREMGLANSTIYYYYKKIRGRKFIVPKFKIQESEIEGEIIGAFAADGSACPQSQYQITFCYGSDEEEYVKNFKSLLTNYFNKVPYFYNYSSQSTLRLRYKSKPIYEFFKFYLKWNNPKTYSVQLRTLNHPKGFLIGFLRGFFDGDGYNETKFNRIELMSVCFPLIGQLAQILTKLGFQFKVKSQKKPGNRKTLHTIRISRNEAKRFKEFVAPRNPKRVGPP